MPTYPQVKLTLVHYMYRPNGKGEKPYVISKVQSATAVCREPIKIAAPSAESSDDELNDDDVGLTPSLLDAVPIIDGTPPATPTKRKAKARKRSPSVTSVDDDYEQPSDGDDDDDEEDDASDSDVDDDEVEEEDDKSIGDLASHAAPMPATSQKKRGNRSAPRNAKPKKNRKTTKTAKA